MTVTPGPSAGGIPPGVGLAPPPSVSMPYWPHAEDSRSEGEDLVRQRERALQDVEADQHQTTAELQRDAEQTRERVNADVLQLRSQLGLDPDASHAHGPFAPVRRHPFTVAVAAAGAATAAVVGVHVIRDHRRSSKAAREAAREAIKASERRRKASRKAARRRWSAAKGALSAAALSVGKRRTRAMRRLARH